MLNPSQYLDGRRYTLTLGDQFQTPTERAKVRQAIYRAAKKAGVRVSTRVWHDGRLEVQAEVGAVA